MRRILVLVLLALAPDGAPTIIGSLNPAPDATGIPVAVLGDSDSHSYGDRLNLGDPGLRGGSQRSTTLQWTEIWQRLRPWEIDLGPWGRWGTRGRIAALRRALGLHGRAPPKEDFRHNFAVSGARCASLQDGMARQVEPLLDLLAADPARWATGVVVIRIGVNSFGQPPHLDRLAAGETLPEVRECAERIRRAVEAIHARVPETRIVLVGIFNNVHWAKVSDRWQDPEALRRIDEGLTPFDDALRAIAATDDRVAFHDDRAWMATTWGGRDLDGRPAYRTVTLPDGTEVTNTVGDAPTNIVVADGHLGTVANGLWLASLIALANDELGFAWTPVSREEIAGLLPGAGL